VRGDAPFDIADSDEFIEGWVSGLDPAVVRKLRRGDYAVQGHVDLHGMTRAQAKGAVERAMREALVVNPSYVDVYFSLGELYADKIKDQKKSVEAFERYLELGGNHSRAREAVAQSRK